MSDPKLASNLLVSVATLHASTVAEYEQRLQEKGAALSLVTEQLKRYQALAKAATALVNFVETPISLATTDLMSIEAFAKRITDTCELAKVVKECLSPSGSSGAPPTPPT